jgi:hypothetical protein
LPYLFPCSNGVLQAAGGYEVASGDQHDTRKGENDRVVEGERRRGVIEAEREGDRRRWRRSVDRVLDIVCVTAISGPQLTGQITKRKE